MSDAAPQIDDSLEKPRTIEPTIGQIIATARAAPAGSFGVWLVAGSTVFLTWCSFTPVDWGPVGWICLVPLMLLIRIRRRTRHMYLVIYVSALVGSLATLQWMRLGDPSMYLAWFALSVYIAAYLPVFVALSRVAVIRFRVLFFVALPVVWVGLEFIRAYLVTGFSWYYLGHTQYHWAELIQISDLTGAYGVSFLMAMTSACLAGLAPDALLARLKLIPPSSSSNNSDGHTEPNQVVLFRKPMLQVTINLLLFLLVLGYGYIRRGQTQFTAGPRIALIQGNFTTSMKHDPNANGTMFHMHQALTGLAVKHQPDLVVWPETMFRWPLLEAAAGLNDRELQRLAPYIPVGEWQNPRVRETLSDMSKMSGAAMIIGIDAFDATSDAVHQYNSAVFIDPKLGIRGRYDKRHRVIFGEYIPLRKQFPWLARLTPIPPEFGIEAGKKPVVFRLRNWRLAPIICFEDTVPHLVRDLVGAAAEAGHPIDCLVNLTNDGWFHGSSELDQHLITSIFRCVECRTPMVRAVNTGISAVIDGDGVVREPELFLDGDTETAQPKRLSMRDPETGRWHKQRNVALVDIVPLDPRSSFYVCYGDWFAGSCCCCVVLLLLTSLIRIIYQPSR